jgi:F0F1-type ATP synthase membrane subunit b/b'
MKVAIAAGLINLGIIAFVPQVEWRLKIPVALVFSTPGVVGLFTKEKVLKSLKERIEGLLEQIDELEERKESVHFDEEETSRLKEQAEGLMVQAQEVIALAEAQAKEIVDAAKEEKKKIIAEADAQVAGDREVKEQELAQKLAAEEKDTLDRVTVLMEAAENQKRAILKEAEAKAKVLVEEAEATLRAARLRSKYLRAAANTFIVSARSKAEAKGAEILGRKEQQAEQILVLAKSEKMRWEGLILVARNVLKGEQEAWKVESEGLKKSLRQVLDTERSIWGKEKESEQQRLEREKETWEEERRFQEHHREVAFLKHLEGIEEKAVDEATQAVEDENTAWREQQLNNTIIPLRLQIEQLENTAKEYRRRWELEVDRNKRLLLPRKANNTTTAGLWANRLIEWFWAEHAIALNHESSNVDEGVITVRVSPHPGHPAVGTEQLNKVMKTGKFTHDMNIPDLPVLNYCEDGWQFVFNVNPAPWGGKPPIDEPAVRAYYAKVLPVEVESASQAFGGAEVGAIQEARQYFERMMQLKPQIPLDKIPGFNEKISSYEIELVDWLVRYRHRATGKPNITEPMMIAEALYGLTINEEKANTPTATTERFLTRRVQQIFEHINFPG